MPIFPLTNEDETIPPEFRLFKSRISSRGHLIFFLDSVFGRKNPLSGFYGMLFWLNRFLPLFSFVFFDFMMQKPVVFHDVPAYGIQHEFFIYFFF